MSTEGTIRMLSAYFQGAPVTMFFSGFFQSPEENFYDGESVEIDIEREDEDIAIAITDLSTGYRFSEEDVYTNKNFIPPKFSEAFKIKTTDLIKRMVGQNPFLNPDFQANATLRAMKGFRKRENKIKRTIELQGAQILQTGTVTLIDFDGNEIYTIDYKPKATHFPTVTTPWDASGDIVTDIRNLCNVIRNDGKSDPVRSIWGEAVMEVALTDTDFISRFKERRLDQGSITSIQPKGEGAQFRGVVDMGNYKIEIWTYGGRYKHPQTGVMTKYMSDKKVIIMSPDIRLDATFGSIPWLVPPDQRVLPFLPSRASSSERRLDMHFNAWLQPDGNTLLGSVGARPLLIPTAIDKYGCIDSDITI